MKSLIETVEPFVELRKVDGGNLKGLCPFCHSRLPDFQISPAKELWHCFGCQRGGDVRAFISLLKDDGEVV